ncbi:GNAT family N-acetyltransferase [Spirochaeta cellobiosiphila]|uniref:GNAT family N-acetyltransferase n=1 Tax=Spirochaeta cellobiosiphila TaxID=504483 RepID=UPI001B7FB2FF|nr:GNAT family protein [Spirochaeta cellobiosiphila]
MKKIEESDIEDLFSIYSNENVFKLRPGKAKKNIDTVKNMIGHFERDFNKKKMIFLGIYQNFANKKLVGIAEIFDINKKVNSLTIGYTLNEKFWGEGYATESTKLIVSFLFNKIKINRIQAFVMPQNVKSKKVLIRNNFLLEGTLRSSEFWLGKGVVDLEVYSILKSDFTNNEKRSRTIE